MERKFKKQRAIKSKSCLSDNQQFSSNTFSSKENDNNDREEQMSEYDMDTISPTKQT